MGKRSKRRIHQKERNSTLPSNAEDPKEIKFFLSNLTSPTIEHSSGFKVMNQVKDCINEIYSEHIHDLEMRKQKRLKSKNPTEYFHPYNLVVNSAYKTKIKSNILEIKPTEHFTSFKTSIIQSIDVFIDYLHSHIQEFVGMKALLQGIIIYEAFHTLQNSITQIGTITEDVVSRKEFDSMMKLRFKEKVMSEYEDLVECVIKKEQSEYVEDLLRMQKVLDNLEDSERKELGLEQSSVVYSDSCSDEDFNVEAFHNLPIDDLVKIINESSKKKSRTFQNQSRSTLISQTPPINEESIQISDKISIKIDETTEALLSSWLEEYKNTEDPIQPFPNTDEKLESYTKASKVPEIDFQESIEPKSLKEKKSKSRLNTAENSFSPLREEVDREVESFRQRLELEKPFEVKIRPLISDEFLESLRSKLKLK